MKAKLRGLVEGERTLRDVMLDKGLAGLGDSLLNFAFSIARSLKEGSPMGGRVDNRLLADALKASGLRGEAPRRMDRHELADASEAILAYGWLAGLIGFWDVVEALTADDPVGGLSELMRKTAGSLDGEGEA